MRHAKDYTDGSPIYSFVEDDGENVHIDVEALRQWCLDNAPEIFSTDVRPALIWDFERDNSVRPDRMIELARDRIDKGAPTFDEPILMVKDGTFGVNGGPNVLLVDGHHRYAAAIVLGDKLIECWVLEPEQWEEFRIYEMPTLTQEQLRNLPPRPQRR